MVSWRRYPGSTQTRTMRFKSEKTHHRSSTWDTVARKSLRRPSMVRPDRSIVKTPNWTLSSFQITCVQFEIQKSPKHWNILMWCTRVESLSRNQPLTRSTLCELSSIRRFLTALWRHCPYRLIFLNQNEESFIILLSLQDWPLYPDQDREESAPQTEIGHLHKEGDPRDGEWKYVIEPQSVHFIIQLRHFSLQSISK